MTFPPDLSEIDAWNEETESNRAWCLLVIDPPSPLTFASPEYFYQEADITIFDSYGADFTLTHVTRGLGTTAAAIKSSIGGGWQCGGYFAAPDDATLDGGSTQQRWIGFGAQVGFKETYPYANNPFQTSGLDVTLPILASGATPISCAASTIGYNQPNQTCLFSIFVRAYDLVNGDSIPLDDTGPYSFGIWRVSD